MTKWSLQPFTRTQYKFLGVQENLLQDEKLATSCAAKEYLRRVSVIWSNPLSDLNLVVATNQYALLVLSYLMCTQHWPLSELRNVDREPRKIILENGGKHPAILTSLLYLPRDKGGGDSLCRTRVQTYKDQGGAHIIQKHRPDDAGSKRIQRNALRS